MASFEVAGINAVVELAAAVVVVVVTGALAGLLSQFVGSQEGGLRTKEANC